MLHKRQIGPYYQTNYQTSMILRPRGRKATYGSTGHAIVAVVHMGPNDPSKHRSSFGGTYRHPEIQFCTADETGALETFGMNVTMRWQTDTGDANDKGCHNPSGFCAMPGWRDPYGLGMERADLGYTSDVNALMRVLTLLERARERYTDEEELRRDAYRARTGNYMQRRVYPDDISRIAIGLTMAGVEVRIHNPALDARRSARQSPDLPDADTEVSNLIAQGERYGTQETTWTREEVSQ